MSFYLEVGCIIFFRNHDINTKHCTASRPRRLKSETLFFYSPDCVSVLLPVVNCVSVLLPVANCVSVLLSVVNYVLLPVVNFVSVLLPVVNCVCVTASSKLCECVTASSKLCECVTASSKFLHVFSQRTSICLPISSPKISGRIYDNICLFGLGL